ncbi:DUF998 domain-containing protein [Modestobacter sp. I12A-02628]|uniref:DUF998 domain-containing protein n=1 Tax=Goekera deserti TaxID=2497753 RepID=A0A7K3WHD8_9ACTN|nr:DUF998 domain-containing protein [Goekera deserti]MPQ99034.1 DUF998 domain-containing protein [Goekera deserti]NDI47368.1 DUF998 domain-containing protein [Goekera deserti]NEL55898.1 DUF998 domain-containing protein [Goekera deserti]
MSAHRYLWGGLAWLLTLQFFVVEAVAAAGFGGYSRVDDVISDLGTAASPDAGLMNASFLLQGLLIAAGTVLLVPVLKAGAARTAGGLLVVAALGVLLVGFAPSDGNGTLHGIGAAAYLLGGGAGLIALAYAVRPRSEALGTTLALLGLLGIVGTIFFATGVTGLVGEGGTERLAAYVVPLGLPLTGIALWRFGEDWEARLQAQSDGTPSRRQLRAAEREQAAERARQRDDALEAAARQAEQRRTAPPARDPDDDYDEDNPWGARRTD